MTIETRAFALPTELDRSAIAADIALDRDKKAAANKAVIQSRSALAQCLIERGVKPFSIPWDSDYKGLDDLIAGCGIEALDRALAKAEELTGEKPNFKQKPAPNILAEKIAKELWDKLLFDVGGKLWRCFNAGVWHEKTIEEIERFFYERVCLDVPENLPSYIENVVKVAKWKLLQPVWTEVSGLEFIPFKNGVWDVKNRKLLPHHPSFLLTWKLPRDYPTVAGLEFPSIDRFLTQVTKGNQQLKNILIAACNAVLLGRSDLQKAIYLALNSPYFPSNSRAELPFSPLTVRAAINPDLGTNSIRGWRNIKPCSTAPLEKV